MNETFGHHPISHQSLQSSSSTNESSTIVNGHNENGSRSSSLSTVRNHPINDFSLLNNSPNSTHSVLLPPPPITTSGMNSTIGFMSNGGGHGEINRNGTFLSHQSQHSPKELFRQMDSDLPYALLTAVRNSFPFHDRIIPLVGKVKIGRSVPKAKAAKNNALFDCKVLSRNHAVIWYEKENFYLLDTKSSNGTYVDMNDAREKLERESRQIFSGETVQFGIEVNETDSGVMHACVVTKIRLFHPNGIEAFDPNCDRLTRYEPTQHELFQFQNLLNEALFREMKLTEKISHLQEEHEKFFKKQPIENEEHLCQDALYQHIKVLEDEIKYLTSNSSLDEKDQKILQLSTTNINQYKEQNEKISQLVQQITSQLSRIDKLKLLLTEAKDEIKLSHENDKKSEEMLLHLWMKLSELNGVNEELKVMKKNMEMNEQIQQKRLDEMIVKAENQVRISMKDSIQFQERIEVLLHQLFVANERVSQLENENHLYLDKVKYLEIKKSTPISNEDEQINQEVEATVDLLSNLVHFNMNDQPPKMIDSTSSPMESLNNLTIEKEDLKSDNCRIERRSRSHQHFLVSKEMTKPINKKIIEYENIINKFNDDDDEIVEEIDDDLSIEELTNKFEYSKLSFKSDQLEKKSDLFENEPEWKNRRLKRAITGSIELSKNSDENITNRSNWISDTDEDTSLPSSVADRVKYFNNFLHLQHNMNKNSNNNSEFFVGIGKYSYGEDDISSHFTEYVQLWKEINEHHQTQNENENNSNKDELDKKMIVYRRAHSADINRCDSTINSNFDHFYRRRSILRKQFSAYLNQSKNKRNSIDDGITSSSSFSLLSSSSSSSVPIGMNDQIIEEKEEINIDGNKISTLKNLVKETKNISIISPHEKEGKIKDISNSPMNGKKFNDKKTIIPPPSHSDNKNKKDRPWTTNKTKLEPRKFRFDLKKPSSSPRNVLDGKMKKNGVKYSPPSSNTKIFPSTKTTSSSTTTLRPSTIVPKTSNSTTTKDRPIQGRLNGNRIKNKINIPKNETKTTRRNGISNTNSRTSIPSTTGGTSGIVTSVKSFNKKNPIIQTNINGKDKVSRLNQNRSNGLTTTTTNGISNKVKVKQRLNHSPRTVGNRRAVNGRTGKGKSPPVLKFVGLEPDNPLNHKRKPST